MRSTIVAAAMLLAAGAVSAAVPRQFSVQGVLRDSTGALQSTMLPMKVRFFDAQTAGTKLGEYDLGLTVPVVDGLFTASIPAPTIIADLSAATQVWLEFEVNSELFPRQLVTPEVYSLMCAQSEDSKQLGGKDAALYLLSSDAASTYQAKGNYLGATAQAADSAKLGGTNAALYLLSSDAASTYQAKGSYLGATAQAADSAKLGGVAPAGYVDTTNNQSIAGNKTFSGAVTAASFSGNGAALTSLNGANLQAGTVTAAKIGAGQLTHSHAVGLANGPVGSVTVVNNATGSCCSTCPGGSTPIIASCTATSAGPGMSIYNTFLDPTLGKACCDFSNTSGVSRTWNCTAVCLSTGTGNAL